MKSLIATFTIGLSLLTHSTSFASLFDDTRELKGKVVVSAGEFEKLDCPIGGKYDCMSWPDGLLRTPEHSTCIVVGSIRCSFKCKGLIATDQSQMLYFFEFSSGIGSVDLKRHSATVVSCPSLY